MTLKLNAATGGGSVSLSAPNSTTSNLDVALTLPVDDGTSGQVLQTDGSGVLSWATASSDKITEGNTTAEVIDTGSDGRFVVTTEGSERLRCDASGRLLVGTPTNYSGYKLQVVHADSTGVLLGCFNGGTNYLSTLSSNGSEASKTVVTSGQELFTINVTGYDGSANRTAATISAQVDGTPGSNDMPGRIVLSTTADGASSPTERMRIRSNGEIPVYNLTTFYPNTDNAVELGFTGNRWSKVWAANGTIQTSDLRSKTEVTTSSLGIDFIKALRPVSYKWIEGGKVPAKEINADGKEIVKLDEDGNYVYESVSGKRTHWGFIAQEVKEAVDRVGAGIDFGGWLLTDLSNEESEQALRYDQFIAPLTKALQEALEKIETLETANASLEARLTALEGGAS